VQRLAAGERPSYGRITSLARDSIVATVPIGYADGVPRRLSSVGGNVLLRGQRRAMIGRVTMDQLMVDCGADDAIERDDEVVLLGRQGSDEISAWEWAVALDTIAYEITCGISSRVPRRFRGEPAFAPREG
jgi:alanine racemase